jgi:DNA-binding MarR family transcriptional regulator
VVVIWLSPFHAIPHLNRRPPLASPQPARSNAIFVLDARASKEAVTLPQKAPRAKSARIPAKLEESIGYMVRNAYRAYDRVLSEAFSAHDILTGQWSLLRVLWDEDNLSQIEVASRMKIERASLTIMLNTVEKAGLITRRTAPGDRRKQLISLTRKGRALESVLVPIGMDVNAIALKGFSQREIAMARSLLQRMIDNLERDRD